MRNQLPLYLILCLAMAACTKQESPPVVGGDRDAHGCIGSAGYTWCEKNAQCERPWELATQKGFANTQEAFAAFCKP